MSTSTKEIFDSKKNGLIYLYRKILPTLVKDGFIQRNAIGVRVNKEVRLKLGMKHGTDGYCPLLYAVIKKCEECD
jgi:hypothetical protein